MILNYKVSYNFIYLYNFFFKAKAFKSGYNKILQNMMFAVWFDWKYRIIMDKYYKESIYKKMLLYVLSEWIKNVQICKYIE